MYYKLMIREYRKLKNVNQKDLSRRIGISQSYLSELENSKYDIKLSVLCRIAKELNVSPKELFHSE